MFCGLQSVTNTLRECGSSQGCMMTTNSVSLLRTTSLLVKISSMIQWLPWLMLNILEFCGGHHEVLRFYTCLGIWDGYKCKNNKLIKLCLFMGCSGLVWFWSGVIWWAVAMNVEQCYLNVIRTQPAHEKPPKVQDRYWSKCASFSLSSCVRWGWEKHGLPSTVPSKFDLSFSLHMCFFQTRLQHKERKAWSHSKSNQSNASWEVKYGDWLVVWCLAGNWKINVKDKKAAWFCNICSAHITLHILMNISYVKHAWVKIGQWTTDVHCNSDSLMANIQTEHKVLIHSDLWSTDLQTVFS